MCLPDAAASCTSIGDVCMCVEESANMALMITELPEDSIEREKLIEIWVQAKERSGEGEEPVYFETVNLPHRLGD